MTYTRHDNNDNDQKHMIQLCYISTAKRLMSARDLKELLEVARDKNQKRHITGMLLYKDMSFLQVLEGEAKALYRIFDSILADDRHENFKTLFDIEIESRDFDQWSMGFRNLDQEDLSEIPGYNQFMNSSLTAKDFLRDSSRAKRTLLYFRSHS